MRINKPQLFNGQYLASNDAILSAFFTNYATGQDVFAISSGATIKDSLINWSALTGSVYGDAIKIDNTAEAQTIKAYIDNAVASVKTYEVSGDAYISADKTEAAGKVTYKLTTNTAEIAKVISGSVIDAADIKIINGNSDLVYDLMVNGVSAGQINIPEDQFLKSGVYDSEKRALVLTFIVDKDDKPGIDTVEIPVSGLIKEFTAGSGIVLNDTVFSGVVDKDSEKFLTVGAAGFKLAGVQAAINAASGAALVDANAYTNSVSGELDTRITNAQNTANNAATAAGNALTEAKAYTDEQVLGKVNSSDFEAFKTANTGVINAAAAAASGAVLGTDTNTQSDLTIYGVKKYVDAKTEGIATDTALGQLQTTVNSIAGSYVNKDQIATAVADDDKIPTNTLVIDYVASHNAVYKVDNFDSVPTDPTLSGLYVDASGNTKFWDGSSDEFVATSEEVISTITETSADTAIPDVGAVKTYVAGQIESTIDAESTTNDAKVPTIGAVKAYIDGTDNALEAVDTKLTNAVETAVTFVSKSPVTIGPTAQTVSGRVIAVYSAEGVCYPTITYASNDADGTVVATISATAELTGCTIVYAKPVVVE